jgi:transcriptional regulator with XRE-family HTH domain
MKVARRRSDPRFDLRPAKASRFWYLRRALGFTRSEVAEFLGRSPLSVYNYEAGKTDPPPEVAARYLILFRRAAKNSRS